MDLTTYVESVRRHLTTAAAAGGVDGNAAERLTIALEPAVRLALMDALSQAAAEITSELPAGSVDVRLRGGDPEFVVDVPAAPPVSARPSIPEPDEADDDERVARITLRIPESLKARVEEIAAKNGYSLNTWLVFAIRMASREPGFGIDIDVAGRLIDEALGGRGRRPGRRMKGWV